MSDGNGRESSAGRILDGSTRVSTRLQVIIAIVGVAIMATMAWASLAGDVAALKQRADAFEATQTQMSKQFAEAQRTLDRVEESVSWIKKTLQRLP